MDFSSAMFENLDVSEIEAGLVIIGPQEESSDSENESERLFVKFYVYHYLFF